MKDLHMLISMIMCTRNRANQLARVLESAAAMRVPQGVDWEFLLVDNGSTDHTAQVAQSFSDRLPIRRIWQPEPGLSNARNAGVAEAQGDYILWTDDDVVIDPGWLAAYADAFAAFPDAAVFGGVIEPDYETEPPQWFQENEDILSHLLAKRDMGPALRVIENKLETIPYGANYALRAREQKRHSYDPDLGVSPRHKRLGEETAVIQAIRDEGGISVWVPEARVRHLIPASRLTEDYVRVYHESAGETWAYLSKNGGPPIMGENAPSGGRRIAGVPFWCMREAVRARVRKWRAPHGSRERLQALARQAYFDGAIRYWRERNAT